MLFLRTKLPIFALSLIFMDEQSKIKYKSNLKYAIMEFNIHWSVDKIVYFLDSLLTHHPEKSFFD